MESSLFPPPTVEDLHVDGPQGEFFDSMVFSSGGLTQALRLVRTLPISHGFHKGQSSTYSRTDFTIIR